MMRTTGYPTGLAKWRQAAMQRRGEALVAVRLVVPGKPTAAPRLAPLAGSGYRAGNTNSIVIGEFVISPEGDPRILGHPQIRY